MRVSDNILVNLLPDFIFHGHSCTLVLSRLQVTETQLDPFVSSWTVSLTPPPGPNSNVGVSAPST